MATRAVQYPAGSRVWSTRTRTVMLSPAASVPEVLLRRSQDRPVPADQTTGPAFDAVSVIIVVPPDDRTSTVRRPALSPPRPGPGPRPH